MPTPTYKAGTGYWTEGPVDPKTNTVGTGQWIEGGTPPTTYSRLPTPTPTPTPAPTPAPKLTPTPDVPPPPVFNETDTRNKAIAQRESQFSAINELYNQRIKQMTEAETKLGAKDLARANTISAMTGMAGGVDATSRAGQTEKATAKIIQDKTDMLNAEKAAQIAGIYDKIDQNVQREKEAALTMDREERARKLDQHAKDAQTNIMAFASQNLGVPWEKLMLDPVLVNEIKKTGKTAYEMQTLYENSLPYDKRPKELFSGWKGDNFVTVRQNADGTTSQKSITSQELGLPVNSDVELKDIDGQIWMLDKKNAYRADGTPNLIKLGTKSTSTTKEKYIPLSTTQKQNIMSTGLSASNIKKLEDDINTHDFNTVLEGLTDPKQREAVKAAFTAGDQIVMPTFKK